MKISARKNNLNKKRIYKNKKIAKKANLQIKSIALKSRKDIVELKRKQLKQFLDVWGILFLRREECSWI